MRDVLDGRRRWRLPVVLGYARCAGGSTGWRGLEALGGVHPHHLVVVEKAHDRQQRDGYSTQQPHLLEWNTHPAERFHRLR